MFQLQQKKFDMIIGSFKKAKEFHVMNLHYNNTCSFSCENKFTSCLKQSDIGYIETFKMTILQSAYSSAMMKRKIVLKGPPRKSDEEELLP
jgi:hypothetical protein